MLHPDVWILSGRAVLTSASGASACYTDKRALRHELKMSQKILKSFKVLVVLPQEFLLDSSTADATYMTIIDRARVEPLRSALGV